MSAVVGADINLGNAKMPHTYSNRYEAFLRSFRDYFIILSVQGDSVSVPTYMMYTIGKLLI